jgi:hypothetical protein
MEKDKWIYYILIGASMEFGNKFWYGILAYAGPF